MGGINLVDRSAGHEPQTGCNLSGQFGSDISNSRARYGNKFMRQVYFDVCDTRTIQHVIGEVSSLPLDQQKAAMYSYHLFPLMVATAQGKQRISYQFFQIGKTQGII